MHIQRNLLVHVFVRVRMAESLVIRVAETVCQRVRPLETTHVCVVGDARALLREILSAMGAVSKESPSEHIDAFELYDRHDLVYFALRYSSQTTESERVQVIEFLNYQRNTLSFMSVFTSILRKFRATLDKAGVGVPSLTPASDEACAQWIRDLDLARIQTHQPIRLGWSDEIEETLAPVMAMLRSEWSKSRLEGVECFALLTDTPENARALLHYEPFVHTMSTISERLTSTISLTPQEFEFCQLVRGLARIVANVVSWHPPDSTGTATVPMAALIRRLMQVYEIRREDPTWRHANDELGRLCRVAGPCR
jgi:hypothetical protein